MVESTIRPAVTKRTSRAVGIALPDKAVTFFALWLTLISVTNVVDAKPNAMESLIAQHARGMGQCSGAVVFTITNAVI